MKKNPGLAGAALAAMLILSPIIASALSIDALQAQVKSLLAQIAQLQGQTTSVQANAGVTSSPVQYRICNVLNRNLTVGTRGDDVSGLQEFLQGQGYLSVSPTGYFGPITAQAVSKWQSSQGVSAVGTFGPMSRDRMKVWCDGGGSSSLQALPQSGSAPLTVTFTPGVRVPVVPDVGGYQIDFGDGQTQQVTCGVIPPTAVNTAMPSSGMRLGGCMPSPVTHTYQNNGTYAAILETTPGNINPANFTPNVVGKVQIVVGGTSSCQPINYMPMLCSDGSSPQPKHNEEGCIIGYECPVANYTPPASCKAWNDGCNECGRTSPTAPAACTMRACFAAGKGYCSVYFDNPATSGNQPPTISGFSGPTTLSVGQTGTWTINASDPENGTLSYSITWGDTNNYAPMTAGVSANTVFVQNTTFTHTYSSVGTFTVTITVRDSAGQSSQTTTTVQVGGSIVCTQEYAPVCAQPPEPACRHTPPYCMILTRGPQTYSNRCMMNAVEATFISDGTCTNGY